MSEFRALWIEKRDDGRFTRSIVDRDVVDLPPGELLIDVRYSSLNYKDALSASGNPGVTRNYPHTPGIDAAGTVIESDDAAFKAGDEVIVIGFDLGMNTPGGFGQRIRIPSGWAVKRPTGLSLKESMTIGTAGFTAALCIDKLIACGLTTGGGPVLVTGATGGVGSVAVKLLAKLGYEVAAVTGKPEQHDFLKRLGATQVLDRSALQEVTPRPLLKEQWGGAIDTVGGEPLGNVIKSLRYGCSVAACGLVAGSDFAATVFPFILRHVNLLGVDSVQLPIAQKARIWQLLANDWKPDGIEALAEPLTLGSLPDAIDRILAGAMVGRGVVDLNA
jgi:acrylyl-CoA reductase (NADPH)